MDTIIDNIGRPSCCFSHETLELLLRLGEGAGGILPLMIGALILGFNAKYHEDFADSMLSEVGADSNNTGNYDSLEIQATAAGSLCLIAGFLAIAWAIIMMLLLVLNIDGLKLNPGSMCILVVDVTVNIVVFVTLLAAGIITAVLAGEWRNVDDDVYGSMIVASVTSFLTSLFPIILAVYKPSLRIGEKTHTGYSNRIG